MGIKAQQGSDRYTGRAMCEYHDFLKSQQLVAKKQKTNTGYIAFDKQGNRLYEYRENSMGSYYVTDSPDGGFSYIDTDKKTGKPRSIEHHNSNGDRQYSRGLDIKL